MVAMGVCQGHGFVWCNTTTACMSLVTDSMHKGYQAASMNPDKIVLVQAVPSGVMTQLRWTEVQQFCRQVWHPLEMRLALHLVTQLRKNHGCFPATAQFAVMDMMDRQLVSA